jgi:hypothetical protein
MTVVHIDNLYNHFDFVVNGILRGQVELNSRKRFLWRGIHTLNYDLVWKALERYKPSTQSKKELLQNGNPIIQLLVAINSSHALNQKPTSYELDCIKIAQLIVRQKTPTDQYIFNRNLKTINGYSIATYLLVILKQNSHYWSNQNGQPECQNRVWLQNFLDLLEALRLKTTEQKLYRAWTKYHTEWSELDWKFVSYQTFRNELRGRLLHCKINVVRNCKIKFYITLKINLYKGVIYVFEHHKWKVSYKIKRNTQPELFSRAHQFCKAKYFQTVDINGTNESPPEGLKLEYVLSQVTRDDLKK